MIVKVMRQKLTDSRAVKNIEISMIFQKELLNLLLQMLRNSMLNTDFLCITLSI